MYGLKGEENREGLPAPVNVVTSRTERGGKMRRTEGELYLSTHSAPWTQSLNKLNKRRPCLPMTVGNDRIPYLDGEFTLDTAVVETNGKRYIRKTGKILNWLTLISYSRLIPKNKPIKNGDHGFKPY